jgi:hypothetical protein
MYDDEHLDDELANLAQSLRGGDHMLACLQLAQFALELDRRIRREERALSFAYVHARARNPLAKVRSEHASLRRLVSSIASALDSADDRHALDTLGKLRSVLLLHVVKEEGLLPATAGPVH